jgi:hypothetical protein
MIFDLNCKPFSPAHTGRKSGSKRISPYTGHSPHSEKIIAIIQLNRTRQKPF